MNLNIGDKRHRNVLLSCDHGLMIINRFDCNHEQVGHGQWLLDHGNCSTVEALRCFQSLQGIENPVIFDVGANIGTFATLMAKTYSSGKIYCFEPQHSVFQQLAGNISINNMYNVFTYNMALGKENTYKEFYQPDYFSNNDFGTFSLVDETKLKTTAEKIVVEIKTLDSFVKIYKIEKIDLIKIDAEGMDLDVLSGGIESINTFRPKLFIEHCDNRKTIKDELLFFLKPFGYHFDTIGNNLLAY